MVCALRAVVVGNRLLVCEPITGFTNERMLYFCATHATLTVLNNTALLANAADMEDNE